MALRAGGAICLACWKEELSPDSEPPTVLTLAHPGKAKKELQFRFYAGQIAFLEQVEPCSFESRESLSPSSCRERLGPESCARKRGEKKVIRGGCSGTALSRRWQMADAE